MAAKKIPSGEHITPLWIIAGLLGLCETVAGIAATKITSGWTHEALVLFVVTFPVLIAAAFFVILWNRNYVLYPPSAYGGDPEKFVKAMRGASVPESIMSKVEEVEASPSDENANFGLIASLVEQSQKQILIFMHEKGAELHCGRYPFDNMTFMTGTANGWFTSGGISPRDFYEKFKGTGLLEITSDVNVRLTNTGHAFAEWLTRNGQKAEFFSSRLGGWGTPRIPSGMPPRLYTDAGQPVPPNAGTFPPPPAGQSQPPNAQEPCPTEEPKGE